MKNLFLYFVVACTLLAMASSCSKEQTTTDNKISDGVIDPGKDSSTGEMITIHFTASYPELAGEGSISEGARSTISEEGNVAWEKDDVITLYFLDGTTPASTPATATASGKCVEFTATVPSATAALWAAYPAGAGSLTSGGVFSINLNNVHSGAFSDANYAVAYAAITDVDNINLAFKNAAGLFRIPIPTGGVISHNAESYTLETITISDKAGTPSFLGSVNVSVNEVSGELEFSVPSDPQTSTGITLTAASRAQEYVYIPSLPVSSTNGLVFRFTDTGGKAIPAAVTKDGKAVSLERGHIKPSAAVDGIVWDWYFSADGEGSGKSSLSPAGIEDFQNLLNGTSTTYGQWRLNGATLHLAPGDYVLASTIEVQGMESGTITIEGSGPDNPSAGGSRLNGNKAVQIINYTSSMDLKISQVRFENAYGSTGAAINTNGATGKLMLDTCTLYNNESSGHGGAIYLATSAEITGCKFSTNTSGNYGGAITIPGTATTAVITISDSDINSNKAKTAGGIANNGSPSLTIYNTTIRNNSNTNASSFGGAMYLNNASKTFCYDCSFTKNTSVGRYGGAAYVVGTSQAFFCRSFFEENKAAPASNDGAAALFASSNALLGVYNCTFHNNPLTASTGAVVKATNYVLANSTFVEGAGNRNSYGVVHNLASSDHISTVVNNIVSHNSTSANHNGIGTNNQTYNHIDCKYNLSNGINSTNLSAASSDATNYSINGSSGNILSQRLSLSLSDNYYVWSGDVSDLTGFTQCAKSQLETLIKANTALGNAFWAWLESDSLKVNGNKASESDCRGVLRDEDAFWPGSYQQDVVE